jgi:histidyl-tRNA synthetase
MTNITPPSGFPEFSPDEEKIRQHWLKQITNIFEKYSFQSITTPLVERAENLTSKGGNAKEIYVLERLLAEKNSPGKKDQALRFDHTVPFALYTARHLQEINFPFRRYTIGPVFRGERAQQGRFRQFDQCDIDIIGQNSLDIVNDALVPAIIIEIFQKIISTDFIVQISHREILQGFLLDLLDFDEENLTTENKEKLQEIFHIIDNLEKFSREKISTDLDSAGLDNNQQNKIFALLKLTNLSEIKEVCNHRIFQDGVEKLQAVINYLEIILPNSAGKNFAINLHIVRGLDYYTGTIYETKITKFADWGSVCSGGRYDNLGEQFSNKKLPGVGISIGLTRLLKLAIANEIFQAPKDLSSAEILIIPTENQFLPASLQLMKELQTAEISVEIFTEDKKFSKKMDYANRQKIPTIFIVGADEISSGIFTIKNMKTGEQEKMTTEEFLQNYEK